MLGPPELAPSLTTPQVHGQNVDRFLEDKVADTFTELLHSQRKLLVSQGATVGGLNAAAPASWPSQEHDQSRVEESTGAGGGAGPGGARPVAFRRWLVG